MARHHSYSKRSRESRKAMGDDADDPDDDEAERWPVADDAPAVPPDPGS